MTKRLSLMLVIALAMLVAMTGLVMAVTTDSTEVTANILPSTFSIDAPDPFTWNLDINSVTNNEINAPTYAVVSTSGLYNSDSWTLTVTADNSGKLKSGDISLYNPSTIKNFLDGFSTLGDDPVSLKSGSGNGVTNVLITLQQVLDSYQDKGKSGDFKLTLTFNVGPT